MIIIVGTSKTAFRHLEEDLQYDQGMGLEATSMISPQSAQKENGLEQVQLYYRIVQSYLR